MNGTSAWTLQGIRPFFDGHSMDFREYAAKETAASLRRLHAGSTETARQQLTTLRTAIEAAAKVLETAANPSAGAEREVADLVDRLTKAAGAAAELATKQLSDEAHKAQEALRGALQSQLNNEKKAAAASLKEARAQSDALRNELATTAKRADDASQELSKAREAIKKLTTERRDLTTARDAEKLARTTAEGELHKTRDLIEKMRHELTGLNQRIDVAVADRASAEETASVAQSQAQAADAKLAAVTDLLKTSAARVKLLERAQQDRERTIRELQSQAPSGPAPVGVARASVAVFEELLSAFRSLEDATTISDVLMTMMKHLATEFSRVALFRVKTTHLQGEHQVGFDLKTDIGKVVVPLGMDSLLTRAAGSGRIQRLSGSELADSSRMPFSGNPTCAIALPVVVADETLAIVYADNSGAAAEERGSDDAHLRAYFAHALLQHAVSLLTRMKAELKALAELRTYARSLVQEIEAMYVADFAAGMGGKELQTRLKINVDYARSIYANRVALEQVDAALLLDDVINAVVTADPPTAFGRDIDAACGQSTDATPKRAAAEAS